MKERTKLALIMAAFASCWFLPVGSDRFWAALQESLSLVRWYAREHVLLCLVPAFFIAGAISVFVRQGAVMKYLGPKAKKLVAYPVAALSARSSPSARVRCCHSLRASRGAARGWGRRRPSSATRVLRSMSSPSS